MASGSQYPDHLNPFECDADGDHIEAIKSDKSDHSIVMHSRDKYPDHLDPFSAIDDHASSLTEPDCKTPADDYDDSLNPFGDDETASLEPDGGYNNCGPERNTNDGNPFAEENNCEQQHEDAIQLKHDAGSEETITKGSPSPELIEPPKPLPRTKSLLKKEQALKRRLQEQQSLDNQANSLQSTSSASTSSIPESNNHQSSTAAGTFQRQKNKRLAPPVPINFRRQVSGSLDAIQEELNEIGDKLEVIDKESNICEETLSSGAAMTEHDAKTVRSNFIELIKRRNSIVRRQKELMYKKRELKLDQLHSDIEYELRMIGNKQQSTRTEEDESKEKDLLKKLVEIVEEKNDIIENLNKDTSCDNRDIEEALKRLNIFDPSGDLHDFPKETIKNNTTSQLVSKGSQSCDKRGIARLSKIATLLPRGDTIRMKRKRLFKKNCASRPIER